MYSDMVTLQTMDAVFYEAQRQGRISFYATTVGEEAINIASAAALTIDDPVFPQVTSTCMTFVVVLLFF
jgi:2-oxoisovalerate dehydrogenase E1 component alpha subunit